MLITNYDGCLSGCSAKFDGYDPSISALRWVLTNGSK